MSSCTTDISGTDRLSQYHTFQDGGQWCLLFAKKPEGSKTVCRIYCYAIPIWSMWAPASIKRSLSRFQSDLKRIQGSAETGRPTVPYIWSLSNNGKYMKLNCHTYVSTAQWSLRVPSSGHYMYRPLVTICTVQWSLYVPSSGHYMYHQLNIQQFYVLPTQCICVFCVDLRTNSDYFTVQH